MPDDTEPPLEPVDPTEVVPGYETDLNAVGTNRVADPALVAAEEDWTVVHPDVDHPALVEAYVTADGKDI